MTEIDASGFSLWDGPSEEVQAQRTASLVSLAQAAVERLWPYLSGAATRADFEQRMGLLDEDIASRVAAVADDGHFGQAKEAAVAHLTARWADREADITANRLRAHTASQRLAGDGMTAEVMAFPQCQICQKADATWDGKTVYGPWAYMCDKCHSEVGVGQGLGQGQKLVLAPSSKESAKTAASLGGYDEGYALGQKHSNGGKGYHLPFGQNIDFVQGYNDGYEGSPKKQGAKTAASHYIEYNEYGGITHSIPASEFEQMAANPQNGWKVEKQDDGSYWATGPEGTGHRYVPWTNGGMSDEKFRSGSLHTASGWIDEARTVVGNHQYAYVNENGFPVTEKTPGAILLDATTASVLVQVYDALSPENQTKFGAMPLTKAVSTAWSLVNKTSSQHTAADLTPHWKQVIDAGISRDDLIANVPADQMNAALAYWDSKSGSKTSSLHEARHPGAQGFAERCPKCGSKTETQELGWVKFSRCPKDGWVGHRSVGVTGSQHLADYQYVHQRGDKWVITQKGTGKVLSTHDSKEKAEAAFRAMMQSKHGGSLHTAETNPPYYIEEKDGKYVVVNDEGHVKGTFDSKEEARQQQKALYANVPGASEEAEKQHGQPKPKVQSLRGPAVAALMAEADGQHADDSDYDLWRKQMQEDYDDEWRDPRTHASRTAGWSDAQAADGFMYGDSVDQWFPLVQVDYDNPGFYFAGVGIGHTGTVMWTSPNSLPLPDAQALATAKAQEAAANHGVVASRRTATTPDWLRERVNDPYGTPNKRYDKDKGEYYDNPFWAEHPAEVVGNYKIINVDGLWYGYDTSQNLWTVGYPDKQSVVDIASGPRLDMWASRRTAVNESAFGTERYQRLDAPAKPSWITQWADEEMKATKEMTEEGMNAYVKPNPFPNLTTLQRIRNTALKMAGEQAYTTKPAQVPGQDEAHMVTLDEQIIPPTPQFSPDMATQPADASTQMGSGGGFDMGYGQAADPMAPTADQLVAAKAAALTERIQLDNPSMSPAEARKVALMTIAKHPEMVSVTR